MPLSEIQCAQCTQQFTPKLSTTGNITKTCSRSCTQWFRAGKSPGQKPSENIVTACPQCATVFTTSHDRKKFCSQRCVHESRTTPKFSAVIFANCLECAKPFRVKRANGLRCSATCIRSAAIREGRAGYRLSFAPVQPHDSVCIDCAGVFTQAHGANKRCELCTHMQRNARARDHKHRRRANIRGNGPVERINSLLVYDRDRWQCHLCDQPVRADVHHLDPWVPPPPQRPDRHR